MTWGARNVANGYKVQWKSGNQKFRNASQDGREAVISGGTTTGYTITGLDNGTEYTVRVLATNAQGDGRPSSRVAGTPSAGGTPVVNDPPIAVVAGISIGSDPGNDGEYVVGDAIDVTVTFSRAVTVTGAPTIGVELDESRMADYVASKSTSTAVVFSYEVQSSDFDQDGAGVSADSLSLNGGTITDTETGNAATLSFPALDDASRHKVLRMPVAVRSGTRVVSSPNSGVSYATGETITVEVAFDRAVQLYTPAANGSLTGIPSYELHFGPTGNSTPRYAGYARIVDGSKVQFDYVVQENDSDANGIGAHNPGIHWNGGAIIRAEMDAGILTDGVGGDARQIGAVRAKTLGTGLLLQRDHRVNAADEPGIRVSPVELSLDEGASGAFDVVLLSQPTDTVTVTLLSDPEAPEVTPSPSVLTFTTERLGQRADGDGFRGSGQRR